MKEKSKKILYRTLKITWIIIGIFILFMTALIYIVMNSGTGQGLIVGIILFSAGVYSLFVYILITLLFLFFKWLIKKIKGKNK